MKGCDPIYNPVYVQLSTYIQRKMNCWPRHHHAEEKLPFMTEVVSQARLQKRIEPSCAVKNQIFPMETSGRKRMNAWNQCECWSNLIRRKKWFWSLIIRICSKCCGYVPCLGSYCNGRGNGNAQAIANHEEGPRKLWFASCCWSGQATWATRRTQLTQPKPEPPAWTRNAHVHLTRLLLKTVLHTSEVEMQDFVCSKWSRWSHALICVQYLVGDPTLPGDSLPWNFYSWLFDHPLQH